MRKTILIFSGGFDSTTLLYKLLKGKKPRREVQCLSFDYGQRHKKELEYARKTCEKLGVKHTIVDITSITNLISNSALTSNIEVPEGHYEDESMKQTVVPNRNMIMSSIAIGYAVNQDYDEVALGVHAGDHQIYPDCRPQFIKILRKIAKIANYKPIKILTPFLHITKGDIAKIGKKLGINYDETWTCYKGENEPCGKCGACRERLEALEYAEKI